MNTGFRKFSEKEKEFVRELLSADCELQVLYQKE